MEQAECAGSEKYGRKANIRDCAEECKGISTMFAFGTNDYGNNRCYKNGCGCLCETAATPDGDCAMIVHSGYRLFRYESGMI